MLGRCAGPVQDNNCGAWECPYGVYPDLGETEVECLVCSGNGFDDNQYEIWECEECEGSGAVLVEVCQACEYGEQPW